MKKIKHFEVFNETYQANLVVVIGGSKDELVSLLKKEYQCDIYDYYSKDFTITNYYGAYFDFEGNYPYKLIWLEKFIMKPSCIGGLVHEISHLVSEFCEERQISKRKDCDEPVAYLMEYYIREIIKGIKKIK